MSNEDDAQGAVPDAGYGGDQPAYTENPYKSRSFREEGGDPGEPEPDQHRPRDEDRGRDDRDRDRDRRHRDDDRRDSRRRDDRDEDRRDRDRDRDRRSDKKDRRDRDERKRSRRDRSRSRSRSRSRTPPRRRRATGFDQGPTISTGFGAAPLMATNSAVQAMGLPGVPVPQAMHPQQATRHARRVYVGGLPPLANEQTVAKFFSQALAAVGGCAAGAAGDAVVNVYINQEKKFAFVEFRTVEETSNAMALDGIMFEGVSVRVRRPNDYNPAMAATLGPSTPSASLNLQAIGLGQAAGPLPAGPGQDGPDRIFVGGLPYYLAEDKIRELLGQFGAIRSFDLVRDRETGNSKGYGFAVYEDPMVVDAACQSLNGISMGGDKVLTVRRATQTTQPKPDTDSVIAQAQQQVALSMALQQSAMAMAAKGMTPVSGGAPMPGMPSIPGMPSMEPPTRIVVLTDVVDVNELADDEIYTEIVEDMEDECKKYGDVASLKIPREAPGLGKVFVEYSAIEGAMAAKTALNGRKFSGKAVKAQHMPEEKYAAGDFDEF